MSMAKQYPITSANVLVLTPTSLVSGAWTRTTWDLTNSEGGYITGYMARAGTTSANTAPGYRVRMLDNDGAASTLGAGLNGIVSVTQTKIACTSTTVNKDAAAGASHVGVAAVGAIAAGDYVSICSGNTKVELHRVIRAIKTSASQLVFDSPLLYAHASGAADKVHNKAEAWGPVKLDGGAKYEIVFDFAAATAGNPIRAWARGRKIAYQRTDY